MHAVVRETYYDPTEPFYDTQAFEEFQALHSKQRGYDGTLVVDAGNGRYLTITLWHTPDDMDAARQELGPVVQRLLGPLMVGSSELLGTGKVVANDLVQEKRTVIGNGCPWLLAGVTCTDTGTSDGRQAGVWAPSSDDGMDERDTTREVGC